MFWRYVVLVARSVLCKQSFIVVVEKERRIEIIYVEINLNLLAIWKAKQRKPSKWSKGSQLQEFTGQKSGDRFFNQWRINFKQDVNEDLKKYSSILNDNSRKRGEHSYFQQLTNISISSCLVDNTSPSIW